MAQGSHRGGVGAMLRAWGDDCRHYWRIVHAFSPNARAFLAYAACTGAAFGIFQLAFNLYLNSLGYSNRSIGLLYGIPSLIGLLAALPIAVAVGHLGYRIFLIAAGGLGAAAALLLVFSSALPSLIVFALAFGLVNTVGLVLAAPFLALISQPPRRAYLFSVYTFLLGVAEGLGNLAGGWLPELVHVVAGVSPNSPQALRWVFAVMALASLLSIIPAARLGLPRGTRTHPLAWRELFKVDDRLFGRILLPEVLIALGAGVLITFFQLYFYQRFRLTPGPTSLLFATSLLFTSLGMLAAAPLAKRFGLVRLLSGSILSSIPFLLLLAFTHSLLLAVVAYYARNLLMNIGTPLIYDLVMDLVPADQRTRISSLEVMLDGLGRSAFGPIASGIFQGIGGYQLAFSFTAATYSGAALLYYRFFHGQGGAGRGQGKGKAAQRGQRDGTPA